MATYTSVSLDDARSLATPFGLTVASVEGLSAGSVNSNYALTTSSGQRVFLRVYEEQSREGAEGESELLVWLADRGIPVARPMMRVDGGGALGEHAGKPVALFPWIPGVIRCQRGLTPRDTFAAGQALARVHLAGAPRPRASRFSVARLLERCDVIATADDPTLAGMADPLRDLLRSAEASRKADAPRGLCHGDLFRDNVLFAGDGSIAAVLDFESAAEGTFAFDLAVTFLAWCYGDDFEPDLARGLASGYQSARPLEPGDRDALHAEAILGALRFMTTRITDYAMRAHLGANVPRDWRRFQRRHERLVEMGPTGLATLLGV